MLKGAVESRRARHIGARAQPFVRHLGTFLLALRKGPRYSKRGERTGPPANPSL